MTNIRISVADWVVDVVNKVIEERHTQKSAVYEELILKGMIVEGLITPETIIAGSKKCAEESA